MSKRPSYQSRQVDLDMSCVIGVVFLTSRLFDYLTSYFHYYIMDHLISQISTHVFLDYYQKYSFCVGRLSRFK